MRQLLVECSAPGLVVADDYTRRHLGLTETCGEGFLRINLDGTRDSCRFLACEYRDTWR